MTPMPTTATIDADAQLHQRRAALRQCPWQLSHSALLLVAWLSWGCIGPGSSSGGGPAGGSTIVDGAATADSGAGTPPADATPATQQPDTSGDGPTDTASPLNAETAGDGPQDSATTTDSTQDQEVAADAADAFAKLPCTSDKQCSAMGLVCNVAAAHCVACMAATDCPAGKVCKANTCVDKPKPCVSSVECPGQVCNKPTGECVDCASHLDCPPEQFCAAFACQPDVCVPGKVQCTALYYVETCTTYGSGWTTKACAAGAVCQNGVCVLKKPCGGACQANEVCDAATDKCVPAPKPGCDPPCASGTYCDIAAKACKPQLCAFPSQWGPDVQKFSVFKIPAGSVGCDLDGDGKVNNAFATSLSAFAGQVNGTLAAGIADGSLVQAMETANFKGDGTPFSVAVLSGGLDSANKTCDLTSETANCSYTVHPTSYDPAQPAATCPPVVLWNNVKVLSGKLSGGGPKQSFLFTMPLGAAWLALKIEAAQLQGQVAGTTSWQSIKNGLICGVLSKKELEKAIWAVPDGQFDAFGGKSTVLGLLGSLLKNDIDMDGDGTKESSSIAIQFETVKGQVTGLTPAPK